MAKRIISLILLLIMITSCLASCNKPEAPTETQAPTDTQTPTDTQKPTETKKPTSNNKDDTKKEEVPLDTNVDDSNLIIPEGPDIFKEGQIKIADTDISEFVIVLSAEPTEAESLMATEITNWVKKITGVTLSTVNDSTEAASHEILLGETNRAESTEVVGDGFKENGLTNPYAFRAIVKNGKLAIASGHSDGYYAAQSSLKLVIEKCKGQLNCDFSNQNLSYDSIKKISTGAVQIEQVANGLKYYKCTPTQEEYWATAHSGAPDNAKAANGCRLDLDTNSTTFYFETTAGNCVFLLNGKQIAVCGSKKFYKLPELDGYKEGTNRVTLILPGSNNRNWSLARVWLDAGSTTSRHEYDLKMLFLGDSITQGYNNNGNEANTYTFYTSEYFNAESIVQGNGGAVFDPKYLEAIDYVPDVIIVAYGCNDWSRYRSTDISTISAKVKAYFDKLVSLYPDTPIIALSPIYRYDELKYNVTVPFNIMFGIIDDVCYNYQNVTVIDGRNFVPHSASDYSLYWNDDIHPNGKGFIEYGKSLTAAIKDQIEAIVAAKSN